MRIVFQGDGRKRRKKHFSHLQEIPEIVVNYVIGHLWTELFFVKQVESNNAQNPNSVN